MPLLYIIRHAAAEDRDSHRWPNDGERPLKKKGAERFRQAMKKLVLRGATPTLIVGSPLARCRQTAEIVLEVLAEPAELVLREELAPGSDLAGIVAFSRRHAGDIAWVGHAPDVGDFAARLIGDGAAAIDFAKGAVAAIEFDGPPAEAAGRLLWLVGPKLLVE